MNAQFEIKRSGSYIKIFQNDEFIAWSYDGINRLWNVHPALKNDSEKRFSLIDFINSQYDGDNLFYYGIAVEF